MFYKIKVVFLTKHLDSKFATTVILIDDDQDDLDVMKEAIKEFDKSILCISFIYPEEAIRVITSELIFIPNFVFIDINMPLMTGDQCLKALRKALDGNVTISMLSTSMPSTAVKTFKDLGADFTFEKPASIEKYQGILRTVFNSE